MSLLIRGYSESGNVFVVCRYEVAVLGNTVTRSKSNIEGNISCMRCSNDDRSKTEKDKVRYRGRTKVFLWKYPDRIAEWLFI